eukprot:s5256_g2.t1
MLCFLSGHFQPGSYDLLRKNCNTFTDCALYFLCGKRLDSLFRLLPKVDLVQDMRYKAVETLACMADERTGILQSITRGEYSPNPEAEAPSLPVDDIDAMRSQTLSLNEMRPVPPVRYSERLPEETELPVPGQRFCKLVDAEVTEMVEIVVDDDTFIWESGRQCSRQIFAWASSNRPMEARIRSGILLLSLVSFRSSGEAAKRDAGGALGIQLKA